MAPNRKKMKGHYIPEAKKSDFALFMMSNKWCRSESCKEERDILYPKGKDEEAQRFIAIQLIDTHEEVDFLYCDIPNYPKLKYKKYGNLTELWEKVGEHQKNEFVTEIRRIILKYLKNLHVKKINTAK